MSAIDAALVERVAKALRFEGSDTTEAEREEIWATKLKEGVKEYWRGFVRIVLREIAAAQVDRNPKGHDPAEGHGRNDESPVGNADAPKLCRKGSTHG